MCAWFVTRLFEWSYGAGGADAFWDNSPELADAVHQGYVRLALDAAAAAFEDLQATSIVKRIADDSSCLPSNEELEILERMTAAVGRNDDARTEFVRLNPEGFAGV